MKKITIDFETRSREDLKKCGALKYAEDSSTEVICMAFKQDDKTTKICVNPKYEKISKIPPDECIQTQDLISLIQGWLDEGYHFEAHNAGFELAIWAKIMVPMFGFPTIPIDHWRCSAAKCAARSLPRSLEEVADVLNLGQRKDMKGHKVMMRLSKPKKPTKADPSEWDNSPDKLNKLFKYCIQDVETEHAVSQAVPELSEYEQKIWFMDQKINQRGINVDIESVCLIITELEKCKNDKIDEAVSISGFKPTQIEKLLAWLGGKRLQLLNLQKTTVSDALNLELVPEVRRMLEIRQEVSKSSNAKYMALKNQCCEDGRVRGVLVYHGTRTGRWSGSGFQPHNLPRESYSDPHVKEILDTLKESDYQTIEMIWDSFLDVTKKLVRNMIKAPKNHNLICADYSSIEARVLAWLAGEKEVLSAFQEGQDIYKQAASGIFDIPYEAVDSGQRQIGKVSILAFGYGGGWRAFKSMADGYGLEAPDGYGPTSEKDYYEFGIEPKAENAGSKRLTPEEAVLRKWAERFKNRWRENNPNIVKYWTNLETAAIRAIRKPGRVIKVRTVNFYVRNDFLNIELPSGRLLAYYKPTLKMEKNPWGQLKNSIMYQGKDPKTTQWVQLSTYSGKIAENITQAVARDLLAEAMLRAEAKGYPVVLHVHDEIVAEIPKDFGSLTEFESIMAEIPDWAEGCPIEAKGWVGQRYRKE